MYVCIDDLGRTGLRRGSAALRRGITCSLRDSLSALCKRQNYATLITRCDKTDCEILVCTTRRIYSRLLFVSMFIDWPMHLIYVYFIFVLNVYIIIYALCYMCMWIMLYLNMYVYYRHIMFVKFLWILKKDIRNSWIWVYHNSFYFIFLFFITLKGTLWNWNLFHVSWHA